MREIQSKNPKPKKEIEMTRRAITLEYVDKIRNNIEQMYHAIPDTERLQYLAHLNAILIFLQETTQNALDELPEN